MIGTRLWLLRHAQTEWSMTGKHTSFTDIPLTTHGEEMASLLGRSLAGKNFSLVLVSPRQRARQNLRVGGILKRC